MIRRIGSFLKRSIIARKKSPKVATLKDLQAIRHAMLACLKDCDSLQAQRLQLKINSAASAQDLWLLRNDAYQVISQRHSQTAAAERINQLMQSFEGWVESRQLVKIR